MSDLSHSPDPKASIQEELKTPEIKRAGSSSKKQTPDEEESKDETP